RVLLAEDNQINQQVVIGILGKQGHSIVTAETGAIALAKLAEGNFDIVLMDVEMPEVTGLEAASLIRDKERDTGGRIPIIALTAHAMKEDRDRCVAAGMDAYLSKPIDAKELRRTIERLTPDDGLNASPSVDGWPNKEFAGSELLASLDGDMDLFRNIANAFVDSYQESLSALHSAIQGSDSAGLERRAHALRGSGGYFLERDTMDLLLNLELMAKEGRLDEASGVLGKLQKDFANLAPGLRSLALKPGLVSTN
ncbi:MAG TPA: response regulator, partial [Blastocatellia bacterium]|nr:response regulator [Blastocatellia bacterium]